MAITHPIAAPTCSGYCSGRTSRRTHPIRWRQTTRTVSIPPVGIYIGDATSGAQVMTRIARNANAGWGRMLDGTPYIFRIRTNPLDLSVDPDDFNTPVLTLYDSMRLAALKEDRSPTAHTARRRAMSR
jgi:hypothetical protein